MPHHDGRHDQDRDTHEERDDCADRQDHDVDDPDAGLGQWRQQESAEQARHGPDWPVTVGAGRVHAVSSVVETLHRSGRYSGPVIALC